MSMVTSTLVNFLKIKNMEKEFYIKMEIFMKVVSLMDKCMDQEL
jgi:hypothetical protein